MTELENILQVDGIIIRRVPPVTVSYWRSSEAMHEKHKKNGGEVAYIGDNQREVMVERKQNTLGGKYLVTFALDQGATVRFDLKRCGLGDTIKQAYEDYFKKNGGTP